MYVVKTGAAGSSLCNFVNIADAPMNPAVPVMCLLLPPVPRSHNCLTGTAAMPWPGSIQICFAFPKENGPTEPSGEAGITSMHPNPVLAGSSFTIDCRVDETAQATVALTDITGKVIETTTTECTRGSNSIMVSTEGLAKGTYMVTVTVGERSQTQRIVVVDGK
jgi:hypothetical protein